MHLDLKHNTKARPRYRAIPRPRYFVSQLAERAVAYGARGMLLLGTDSPHMSAARLHCALRLLRRYDVVLGSAEDGGYDLLAMCGHQKGLFQGMTWGTSAVLNESMSRISELGLSCRCLSMGFDVDVPEDLARLLRSGFFLSGEPSDQVAPRLVRYN